MSRATLIDRAARHLPGVVARVVARLRDEEIVLRAAALAFYALVSAVPFAILVLWLTSAVVNENRVRDVADELAKWAPPNLGIDRALQRISQVGTSVGVGALVTLLWPASSYGAGLARAFEDPRSPKHPPGRGIRGRALSFALMLVVPGLLLLGLVAAYAGTAVAPHGGIFRVVQWVLVVALGFSATTGVLVLIYMVFPRRRLPWRQVWRGAVTGATGVTVLSFGYVVFLRVGADFEKRYATSGLAAIVLLAFWLFLANGLVLVGYEVARET